MRICADNKIVEETAEFWSKRSGKQVTKEEAREIIENVTGFFKVLDEWDKRDKMNSNGNVKDQLVDAETIDQEGGSSS